MIKKIKKNQIIIYVIALMLVTAGYLNYVDDGTIPTSADSEVMYQENLASIGDATLVSSNDIVDNSTVDSVSESAIPSNNIVAENEVVQEETQVTSTEADTTTAVEDDYFAKSKLERDTMYSQMLETYQNIVNSNTVSDEQRAIATQEITSINNTKNSIMICENLLGTKGFENSVVFVNGNSVNIVVKAEGELTQEQVAQIQNVVSREMEKDISDIHISQK